MNPDTAIVFHRGRAFHAVRCKACGRYASIDHDAELAVVVAVKNGWRWTVTGWLCKYEQRKGYGMNEEYTDKKAAEDVIPVFVEHYTVALKYVRPELALDTAFEAAKNLLWEIKEQDEEG